MEKSSQLKEILKWLQAGNTLTSMQAIELWGASRLSGHIFELRKKGYDISTTMRETRTRFGNICNYAEYKLEGVANESIS